MRKGLLTIVVAIYDVDEYLEKCLSSLVNQSSNDYLVLCVNDGSTDNSEKIINKYIKQNSNFFILNKENGGLSSARNYGLERCDTEYISFVDGDDFVSNDYVEISLKEMKNNNLDMFVFGYNQYYLANNSKEVIDLKIEDGVYNLPNKKELLAYTPNAAWNKVYKTSLFKNNKIIYPFGYRHQDLGTTPKLLLKANRIGYKNLQIYNYLIDRPNNLTAQIDKKLYHIIDMSKEVMDYYIKENVYDDYVNEFEYLVKRNFIQSLRKSLRLNDRRFVFKFIDDIFDTSHKYFKNSQHKYNLIEENGDGVYLSRVKCKVYYLYKRLRGEYENK